MKETLKHVEAFDIYYRQEGKRSLQYVADTLRVSRTAVGTWAKAFDWYERAQTRDAEVARRLGEKTIDAVLDQKAKRLKQVNSVIDAAFTAVASAFEKVVDEDGNEKMVLKFKVDSQTNFSRAVASFNESVKLGELLMGESDSRAEETITVKVKD